MKSAYWPCCPAVVDTQYRATTGRDQLAFSLQQSGQCRLFAFAETRLTHVFENGVDGRTRMLDDDLVGIDESEAKAFGQALANGGFAGAHGADQDQVGGWIHDEQMLSPGHDP